MYWHLAYITPEVSMVLHIGMGEPMCWAEGEQFYISDNIEGTGDDGGNRILGMGGLKSASATIVSQSPGA
jgi:hypothetical protein